MKEEASIERKITQTHAHTSYSAVQFIYLLTCLFGDCESSFLHWQSTRETEQDGHEKKMREKEIKKAKPIVIEVNIQHYKSLMMSITISLLCMLQLNLRANSGFQRSHFVRNLYALRIVVCKLSQNFPV